MTSGHQELRQRNSELSNCKNTMLLRAFFPTCRLIKKSFFQNIPKQIQYQRLPSESYRFEVIYSHLNVCKNLELIYWLINLCWMSTSLGLFYVSVVGARVSCTSIFTVCVSQELFWKRSHHRLLIFKFIYLIDILDPNRCYHSESEWTWTNGCEEAFHTTSDLRNWIRWSKFFLWWTFISWGIADTSAYSKLCLEGAVT